MVREMPKSRKLTATSRQISRITRLDRHERLFRTVYENGGQPSRPFPVMMIAYRRCIIRRLQGSKKGPEDIQVAIAFFIHPRVLGTVKSSMLLSAFLCGRLAKGAVSVAMFDSPRML